MQDNFQPLQKLQTINVAARIPRRLHMVLVNVKLAESSVKHTVTVTEVINRALEFYLRKQYPQIACALDEGE